MIDWRTWKSKHSIDCLFCKRQIVSGESYRLEVFYIGDIVHSTVDGKERSVFKPISFRVHAECKRSPKVDYRFAFVRQLKGASKTHDHRKDL